MSKQGFDAALRPPDEKVVAVPSPRNKAVPSPDTGWAWVVAFACFSINFILAGLARSSGVLYVALIDLYQISREAATTPFSMRVCVRNLAGPVVGMLGQKFGIRAVTLAGGLLAGCGSVMCYFAPSVIWITVFWGGVSGLGFGLSTVLHMMMINEYFDKYKGTAIGLGYSGDCIGTFVLPVVMELLIATYGVKSAFLLIGAIVLNVVPMAMLLKPAPWTKAGKKTGRMQGHANEGFVDSEVTNHMQLLDNETARNKDSATKNGTNGDAYTISKTFPRISKRIYTEYADGSFHGGGEIRNGDGNETFTDTTKCDTSYVCSQSAKISERLPGADTDSKEGERPSVESVKYSLPQTDQPKDPIGAKVFDNVTEIHVEKINRTGSNISNRSELTATITDNPTVSEMHIRIRAHSETLRDSTNGGSSATIAIQDGNASIPRCGNNRTSFETKDVSRDLHGDDLRKQQNCSPLLKISYENECQNYLVSRNELVLDAHRLKLDEGERELEITAHQCHRNATQLTPGPTNANQFGREALKAMKRIFRTNIKPMYLLICTTWGVYAFLFVSVITVVIDFAVDKGISEQNGKYVIVAFSAADLAGRLGFGFVIDRGWVEMKNYVALTVVIMGSVVALMPFAGTFLLLSLGMALYGFIQGGAGIVYPILIEKYMDKDERSIAMGCLSFYGGVLMFGMAPMIGFFRDEYGSYDGMFYIVGVMMFLLGLVWFFEPLIQKYQNGQSTQPQNLVEKQ